MAVYRGLTIEIGGNVLPLKRALTDVSSDVRVLSSEARKLSKEFQFNPDLSNIRKIRDNYADAIEKTKELSESAQKRLNELMAKGADENDRDVKRLQIAINNAQRDIASFNLEIAKLGKLEARGIEKTLEESAKQADAANEKVRLLREKLEGKFTRNALKELQEASQAAVTKTAEKLDRLRSILKELEDSDPAVKQTAEFQTLENQVIRLQTELETAERNLKNIGDINVRGIEKTLEESAKQADAANEKVRLLREKLEGKFTRNALKELQEASQAAVTKTAEKLDRLRSILKELEEADPAAKQTAEFKELENQVVRLQNELVTAEKDLKKIGDVNLSWLSETFKDIGTQIESAGKALIPLSATATAGLTLAAKAAIKQESAFAGVRKTVEATEAEYAALKEELIEMSEVIPLTAAELMGIAETAGQLGIQRENIAAFTEVMAGLGVATNLAGEAGASTLAKFANITKTSQQDFERLGSTIVALGNNSATTEKDIAEMAMNLAGAGKQADLTEAEILSLAAFLSSVGLEAAAGGSAISRVINEMLLAVETGGGKLKDFAAVAGMSAAQFQKAFKEDAAGALFSFVQGLAIAKEEGGSAVQILDEMGLSNIRINDALLRSSAAAQLFTDTMNIGAQAWEENNALAKESAERFGTTESKLIMTKNAIENAAASIGEKLTPYLGIAADKVQDFAEWLDGLDDETKEIIVRTGLLTAAIAPLLVGIGNVSSAIGTLFTLISKHPVALLTAAFATLVTALYQLSKANNEAFGTLQKVNGELKKSNDLYEDNIAAVQEAADRQYGEVEILEELIAQYGELNDGVKNNRDDTEALTQKKAELYDVVQKIQSVLPDVVFEIDRETGAYINQTSALSDLAAAKRAALDADVQYEEAKAAKLALNKLDEEFSEETLKKQFNAALDAYNKTAGKQIRPEDFGGFGDMFQMAKDLAFWTEGSATDVQKKGEALELAAKNLQDYYDTREKLESKVKSYVEAGAVASAVPSSAETSAIDYEAKHLAQTYESVGLRQSDYWKDKDIDSAVRALRTTRKYGSEEQKKSAKEILDYSLQTIEYEKAEKIRAAEESAEKIRQIEEEAAEHTLNLKIAHYGEESKEGLTAKTEYLKKISALETANAGQSVSASSGSAGGASSGGAATAEKSEIEQYNALKQRLELEYNALREEEQNKKTHYDALLTLQAEYLETGSDEWLKAQKELNSLKKALEKENLDSYKQAVSDMKFESDFSVEVNGADKTAEYKRQADEISEYRRQFLLEGTREYMESLMEESALRKKFGEETVKAYESELARLDANLRQGVISWEQYYRDIEALRLDYEGRGVDTSGLDSHVDALVYGARRGEIDSNFNNYDLDSDLTGEKTYAERLAAKKSELEALYADMAAYLESDREALKQIKTDIAQTTAELNDIAFEGFIAELKEQLESGRLAFDEFSAAYLEKVRELYGEVSKQYESAENDLRKIGEDIYKSGVDAYTKTVRELGWLRDNDLISYEQYLMHLEAAGLQYLQRDSEAWTDHLKSLYSLRREYELEMTAEAERAAETAQREAEKARQQREKAEKEERERLDDERQAKVDELAKEKEAELQAALEAGERVAEAAAAAEKTRLEAEKARLNEEKNILNERVKAIDAEIKKRRELMQARTEQNNMENLQKQLAAAKAEYKYAREDGHGDDFDIENKRLVVVRLEQEIAAATQKAEDEAFIASLEEEKTLIQEQTRVIEDSISNLKTELTAAVTTAAEDIRTAALEWAESQIPPVTEEEIERAVTAALAGAAAETSSADSGGYESGGGTGVSSTYAMSSAERVAFGEKVAKDYGTVLRREAAATAGSSAKSGTSAAPSTVNNVDITVNANGLTKQQAEAVAKNVVNNVVSKEFSK